MKLTLNNPKEIITQGFPQFEGIKDISLNSEDTKIRILRVDNSNTIVEIQKPTIKFFGGMGHTEIKIEGFVYDPFNNFFKVIRLWAE